MSPSYCRLRVWRQFLMGASRRQGLGENPAAICPASATGETSWCLEHNGSEAVLDAKGRGPLQTLELRVRHACLCAGPSRASAGPVSFAWLPAELCTQDAAKSQACSPAGRWSALPIRHIAEHILEKGVCSCSCDLAESASRAGSRPGSNLKCVAYELGCIRVRVKCRTRLLQIPLEASPLLATRDASASGRCAMPAVMDTVCHISQRLSAPARRHLCQRWTAAPASRASPAATSTPRPPVSGAWRSPQLAGCCIQERAARCRHGPGGSWRHWLPWLAYHSLGPAATRAPRPPRLPLGHRRALHPTAGWPRSPLRVVT